MFELLIVILFFFLMIKTIGFALRLTWGAAKIAASILMVIALPALILCLIFTSSLLLVGPLILIAIAAGILKNCLNT